MAFDEAVMDVIRLTDSSPDEALRLLDHLNEENALQDYDGWLQKSIKSQRALIFATRKRYHEARNEILSIPTTLLRTAEERTEHTLEKAWVLSLCGEHGEARQEIEEALVQNHGLSPNSRLRLLTKLVEFMDPKDDALPESLSTLSAEVIQELGIPVRKELQTKAPVDAIRSADRLFREAGHRYASLMARLVQKTPDERTASMQRFAQIEPVGFYRQLASRFARK
ncbi:hypothetical protein [Chondromyces crocatus]|nr:hypothetical protein [Chondromyces crocatus]